MEWIKEFFTCYSDSLLMLTLTVIFCLLGERFGKLYRASCGDETKKNIAALCVKATEQVFAGYSGETKNDKAREGILSLLAQRGIEISEEELSILIESAVNDLKQRKEEKKHESI